MNIYMQSPAYLKTWLYVESVTTEVGGFGFAYREGDDIIWADTFLVPQTVSTAAVDFNEEGLAFAIEKAAAEGWLDRPDFVWVSWHSHHTMNAYWSSTDEECIKTYAKLGLPYLLSFVGNHKRQYVARVDHFNVAHKGWTIPQVTMDKQALLLDPQDPVLSQVQIDLEALVKKEAPKQWSGAYTTGGHRPKALPPKSQQKEADDFDEFGWTLEEAFEIAELMKSGCTREVAEDIVVYGVKPLDAIDVGDNGYEVGPAGLVETEEVSR